MSKRKTEFKFFTIADYEKEQDYLREMHNHGWRFKRVSGFCMYHFEECEPMDMIYQLDYNQEGIAHKAEYVQMFEDCGWEYMQDYFGFSYFRKPVGIMNEDESIFCDNESRLEFMKRIFKGRLVPLLVIFFMVIIPQLITQLMIGEYGLVIIYAVLLTLYLSIFVWYGKQYYDFKRHIYNG